jgi:anti-sigma factor RsiW
MSACDRTQTLLAEWISGELDAADAADVREHLATCASCRADESEMRGVVALLEQDAADGLGSGVEDPGAAYWASFADRVAAQSTPRAKAGDRRNVAWIFGRLPRFVGAGLAAAAVLVVALDVPTVPPVPVEDSRLAELFTESVAFSPLADLSDLENDDLDRLGEELVSSAPPVPGREVEAQRSPAAVLDGLEDLSTTELEKLLEQLDAFET